MSELSDQDMLDVMGHGFDPEGDHDDCDDCDESDGFSDCGIDDDDDEWGGFFDCGGYDDGED